MLSIIVNKVEVKISKVKIIKDASEHPRLLIRKALMPEQILWPFSEKGLADNLSDVKSHILKNGIIRYCTSNKRFF